MAVRALLPSIFILLCVFILVSQSGIPGHKELVFAVTLNTVFFWSMYQPRSMTTPMTFFIGVTLEALTFGPPGIMLFSLLVVHETSRYMWIHSLIKPKRQFRFDESKTKRVLTNTAPNIG